LPTPVIRPLTVDLLPDWLHFFDHDAFADHPDWAGCYCYYFHADHSEKEWDARTAEENREASSALIRSGRLRGYLAYLDERPVGWCQAAPRSLIRNIAHDPRLSADEADDVGSMACFVVARPFRGMGVARQLLRAACDGFRTQGLRIAEGYPRVPAEGDAGNYHGPLALYLSLGFAPYAELEGITVVKRLLSPDHAGLSERTCSCPGEGGGRT
jgi:GNAT superfamily N-acetyltransferase